LKLWKGLYFGMWMADKRPIQQELSVNIALLLKEVPRAKQAMWIETFWETMQSSWEKLDVHRISKYLQFMRIVVAEAFKCVRVAGWPLEEMRSLGNIFTRKIPNAKEGQNAPSLGLLLQFTRILWEELRPQLEVAPAPRKAVLALLEPFFVLAEYASIDSLVRHIHEHIIRRAPHEILVGLAPRMLTGAARPDVPKKNRQALYDTADALEKLAMQPAAKGVKPLRITGTPLLGAKASPVVVAKVGTPRKSPLPPLQLPPSAEKLPAAAEQAGKKKKRKKKKGGEMTPLVLPEAAPVSESDGPAAPRIIKKRKLKRKAGAGTEAGSAGKKKQRL